MENKLITAAILLMFLTSGCYKEKQVNQNDVILSVTGDHTTIPADGVSKQTISVRLPDETTDATNSIVFTTTKGTFDIAAKNTITVAGQDTIISGTQQKVATVSLTSTTDEGPAYVTATIKNYSYVSTVTFGRAYPDIIHVNLDKLNYQIGTTSEIMVTVQIRRSTGKGTPSTGQTITLAAFDTTMNPIGNFRNLGLTVDATGNVVTYLSLPLTTTYVGIIQIKAGVQSDASGRIIYDTAIINAYK